jgi:tetratricopeptide (TPR) repeat protein
LFVSCAGAPKSPGVVVAPEDPGVPTTSGDIAFSNLSSQIESAEQDVSRQRSCAPCRTILADLLLTRAQVTGATSDLERALTLSESALKLSVNGSTVLGRGRARAALHLFAAARRDAMTALYLRARSADVYALLASLDEATGHLPEAMAFWDSALKRRADTNTLGHVAILTAALGDPDRASELFARAAAAYRDVSPFPIVWLELQEGLAWQNAGDLPRARALFERAHRRLPQSVAVASHLASVADNPDGAIALLLPFQNAEDPEPAGQLAGLLALRHREAEAKALAKDVVARFTVLLQRHPEAYADHAARYWLTPLGNDRAKALLWATRNLGNRRTTAAYELYVEAASRAQTWSKDPMPAWVLVSN